MSFLRPTPQAIRDRVAAEIEAALPGADARTRRSVEEILARMLAVASHELHGHLAWAAQQLLPDTAEAEVLARHASIWGITRRAAAPAIGPVTFSGLNGAVVPAGSELRRADDVRYTVVSDTPIGVSLTGTGQVIASVAGAAGNAAAATALAFVTPAVGVASAPVVAAGGLGAGADAETDDALRARLLARIQMPPAGGAANDYVAWAQTVADVGRVYVIPEYLGPGTVGVTFLTSASGIPAGPLVASVAAAIAPLRPVTAAVTVFAPTAVPQNLSIQLFPNTLAVQAAVAAEAAAFFLREAAPGATFYRSRLSAAISAAVGENAHNLLLPAADVALTAGQVATLGTITWS